MDSSEERASSEQQTILIVEDEAGPRETLKMVLGPFYNLYSVDNADVALKLLQEQPIDLVTLDLKLPGKQGIELLEEIRKQNKEIEVIIITGYGTLQSAIEAIRHGVSAYILKPFNVAELLGIVNKTLDGKRRINALKTALQAFGELWTTQTDPTTVSKNLGKLLEAKNPDLAHHAKRVNFYTSLLAEHLQLSTSDREVLQLGAYLHDVGKLGIQDRLLLGETPPADQEAELLKCHPTIGERLIQSLDLPQPVGLIIRHHHERYDGSGYPDGLSGNKIPYLAHIVALANVFDNLITGQSDQGPFTIPQAREYIREKAETFFDPKLVEVFSKVVW